MNKPYSNVQELFDTCNNPPEDWEFYNIILTILHANTIINDDTCTRHEELDQALCILLSMIGYEDAISLFESADKYYS